MIMKNIFKIAIVYCNSDEVELDGNDASVVPALGAAYIVSSLKEKNLYVDYYDCPIMGISNHELIDILKSKEYQMVGFSVYAYNYKNSIKITNILKNESSNVFVLWGGYFATLNYEYAMFRCRKIDCCVLGEGEITTPELVLAIKEKKNWKSIKGIVFREGYELVMTEKRDLISNLDQICFPERACIVNGTTSLMTSRGCYGNCIFCCIQSYMEACNGNKIRFRSVDNVIHEIEFLIREKHVNFLQINDDNFMFGSKSHKKWIMDFCIQMKEKKLEVDFFIYARANDIIQQADMLGRLKEVGLKRVFVGFESFCQRQLSFYNKGVTVEQNKRAFQILAENEIPIIMGFMVLEPYVTIEELIENVRILDELQYYKYICDSNLPISLYPKVIPYYGTRLYQYYKKNNLLQNDNFVNESVNEWYKYLIKWIQIVEKFYTNIELANYRMSSSSKKMIEELHKIDLEFWIDSLELVREKHFEDCLEVLERQKNKLYTFKL